MSGEAKHRVLKRLVGGVALVLLMSVSKIKVSTAQSTFFYADILRGFIDGGAGSP
jgi:hypothetical protein